MITQSESSNSKQSTWHIVWTTLGNWPVTDQRGDWQTLNQLYKSIAQDGGSFDATLPSKWNPKPQNESLVLSPELQGFVQASIEELTAKDRVGKQFELTTVCVFPNHVQLLGRCLQQQLNQTVGRLKSRTATLLSFETKGTVGGAGTWTQGFWKSQLLGDVAITKVANFLEHQKEFTK